MAWDTVPHYIHRPWTLQKWPETQYLTTYIGPGTLQKWPETQMVPHYTHRPLGPYRSGLRHRWYLTTHTVQALDSTEVAETQMVPHYTHRTLQRWFVTQTVPHHTHSILDPREAICQHRQGISICKGPSKQVQLHLLHWSAVKAGNTGQRYQPSTALTLIRFIFLSLSLSIFSHDFKNNSTTIKQI